MISTIIEGLPLEHLLQIETLQENSISLNLKLTSRVKKVSLKKQQESLMNKLRIDDEG